MSHSGELHQNLQIVLIDEFARLNGVENQLTNERDEIDLKCLGAGLKLHVAQMNCVRKLPIDKACWAM